MISRRKFDPSIYFVLDPSVCGDKDPYDVARAALKGGVTMLQLRDKSGDLVGTPELAKKLLSVTRGIGVPLIINDDVELAKMVRADGVHLGQGDMKPEAAREILGPDVIIGVTAFAPAHIEAIDPAIVDYIGMGPFYETKTDKGKPVLGAEKFAELAALSSVSVVGIGGITPERTATVMDAGANGVAMMRSISEADDPEAAAQKFVLQLAIRSAGGGYRAKAMSSG